jgi:hypothetical protein
MANTNQAAVMQPTATATGTAPKAMDYAAEGEKIAKIQSAASKANESVTMYKPTAQAATTREVKANETVQQHLGDIMSTDNRLNTLARQEGLALANKRGLINSSIAGQASTDALIKNAMPIATQDANTYATQARANQDATNTFARDANANEFAKEQMSIGQSYTRENQAAQSIYTKEQMAEQDKYAKETLASQQAHDTSIEGIRNTNTLGQMDKQNEFSKETLASQQAHDTSIEGIRNTNTLGQMDKQNEFSKETLASQQAHDTSIETMRNTNTLSQMEVDQKNKLEQLATQSGLNLKELEAQNQNAVNLRLTEINAQYRTEFLNSVTDLQKGYNEQLTATLSNPNLKADQITNAMAQIKTNFQTSLDWVSGTYAANEKWPIDFTAFPGAKAASGSQAAGSGQGATATGGLIDTASKSGPSLPQPFVGPVQTNPPANTTGTEPKGGSTRAVGIPGRGGYVERYDTSQHKWVRVG